eukprot:482615_1
MEQTDAVNDEKCVDSAIDKERIVKAENAENEFDDEKQPDYKQEDKKEQKIPGSHKYCTIFDLKLKSLVNKYNSKPNRQKVLNLQQIKAFCKRNNINEKYFATHSRSEFGKLAKESGLSVGTILKVWKMFTETGKNASEERKTYDSQVQNEDKENHIKQCQLQSQDNELIADTGNSIQVDIEHNEVMNYNLFYSDTYVPFREYNKWEVNFSNASQRYYYICLAPLLIQSEQIQHIFKQALDAYHVLNLYFILQRIL